ncbi:hypothetical protein HNQ38_002730 [Desulfovibrio intestinalis]|uniref:Uncharacterized protein n=1 Tax=Desulfovibrio intestinalis TaxID=58621 RepID=A0A7W8C5C3_9BACT|nr:hypothetical protein [Desulfovibrio intestinalis]
MRSILSSGFMINGHWELAPETFANALNPSAMPDRVLPRGVNKRAAGHMNRRPWFRAGGVVPALVYALPK